MTETVEAAREALEDLFQRIDVKGVDRGALTLIARRTSDHGWALECASIIFGPATMSSRSWPEWARLDRPHSRQLDLSVYRVREADWRSFDRIVGNYRYVRFSMNVRVTIRWLTRAAATGQLDMRRGQPIHASLAPPTGLINVFPHVDSPAARLVAGTQRPCYGWFHAATPPSDANLEREWQPIKGAQPFNASLVLLGIVPNPIREPNTPRGLFIGNVGRRAWMTDIRGSKPDFKTFDVGIHLDPAKAALWELVLDLEEATHEGDLLTARRLRLGDVALPAHGTREVTVRLPTLRRKVTRRLRLFDLDGRLLDAANDIHIAESIVIATRLNDTLRNVLTVGVGSSPTGEDRLGALDKVEQGYASMLQSGMPGRIVREGQDGKALVAARLAAARGQLLIFDPYIGRDPADWSVLTEVTVPVRVLTGNAKPLPPVIPSLQVDIRSWAGSTVPPFHDRAYLWDGGGLTVGTSPNGLGRRLSLIDNLEPAVADGLRALFEAWWCSPNFRTI